eukprot:CAMPEP_0174734874 /NCGR_PEP_ID=MMETSP1094-20130205/64049_1 /TAXON_ID=156173 /ORGANISM="Chrysochromulina brevifilum, Strain UTEX LB 985" /LENGTH=36 /DNA_ID= /DNA_START= /DNA_END= /DNA_ORIENTATION=
MALGSIMAPSSEGAAPGCAGGATWDPNMTAACAEGV